MEKRIYWVLVLLVAISGLGIMIYYGVQPKPIPKIKLSQFESPRVLANSILLRLREEVRNNSVVFLGVEPEHPEQMQVWREFLSQNQEAGSTYQIVVVDENLNAAKLFPEATVLNTKLQLQTLADGIQKATSMGQRVAVITASLYTSQIIFGNLVHAYKEILKKKEQTANEFMPLSFSIVDFPRAREQEKSMLHACIVDGVDQTGMGPFGCVIVQMSRANYRKRYNPGSGVGLVNQVGLKDYLVLYTNEK